MRFLVAALLVLLAPSAHAQIPGCVVVGQQCVTIQSMTPLAQTMLAVSNVSSTVALPATGPTLGALVINAGPATAYVVLGPTSIVATTLSTPVNAGGSLYLPQGTNTTLAAVTASGIATLSITSATGAPVVLSAPVTVANIPLAFATSASASVATTSGVLITAGQFSRFVQVCTLPGSSTNVWLNPTGGVAAASNGVRVASAGGCATFGPASGLPMPLSAVTAITDSGSAQTVTLTGG